jgi:hypothetical protein
VADLTQDWHPCVNVICPVCVHNEIMNTVLFDGQLACCKETGLCLKDIQHLIRCFQDSIYAAVNTIAH